MGLRDIILPWLVIRDLREELALENAALRFWVKTALGQGQALAKFDHDGDGKPGGSKQR